MWNRADLKQKAKDLLSKNYWKMVLVALVLALVTGSGTSSSSDDSDSGIFTDTEDTLDNAMNFISDPAGSIDGYINDITDFDSNDNHIAELFTDNLPWYAKTGLGLAVGTIAAIAIVLSIALGLVIAFFLAYPLEISCKRFFVVNLDTDSQAHPREMGFIWKSNKLKNASLTMFMRDIFIFLWSLLLVIPGIMKAYSYRMVPYILAENPDTDWRTALKKSEDMMMGQRFEAFKLDLSFIGWWILSALTMGILEVFYVEPYYQQTCANLYRAISPKKLSISENEDANENINNDFGFTNRDFEKPEY